MMDVLCVVYIIHEYYDGGSIFYLLLSLGQQKSYIRSMSLPSSDFMRQ